jgi:beta-lactamase regulating signal transducer with metallopeptidase domain/peptidoglycan hydrolase CwlO-like protein
MTIMTSFPMEWAVRSSILIASAALLSWLLRVKDPSIRLSICIAALFGSLAMPLLIAVSPQLPVVVMQPPPVASTQPAALATSSHSVKVSVPSERGPSLLDEWRTAAAAVYVLVAGTLLLRLCTGLLLAHKLRRNSRATGLIVNGAEVRESERVASPVTLGVVRPAIVLPADWREWGEAKLKAVLAHEESHLRRHDPAVQVLSAVHRALLWHSPLSWMLHRRIVRLAEEVSDDAAVSAMRDRTSYAETLLEFMRRGVRVSWQGIAMARYGSADDRIHRVLHGVVLSAGVTKGTVLAILLVAVPLAYVSAAAVPAAVATPAEVARPASTANLPAIVRVALAQNPAQRPTAQNERDVRRYMIVLGTTETSSWDSRDSVSKESLRERFGNRFAWFRQGGVARAITDDSVLRDLERAMEPQRKVNAQQDRVNRLQETVNGLQSKVNVQQNEVNAAQNKVNIQQNKVNSAQEGANKLQDLLNRINEAGSRESKEAAIRNVETLLKELRAGSAATQEEVHRLQAQVNIAQQDVNRLQHEVNLAQERVNVEQNKVNREQDKVNGLQSQVSAEVGKRIQDIFESAVRRGLAKVVD